MLSIEGSPQTTPASAATPGKTSPEPDLRLRLSDRLVATGLDARVSAQANRNDHGPTVLTTVEGFRPLLLAFSLVAVQLGGPLSQGSCVTSVSHPRLGLLDRSGHRMDIVSPREEPPQVGSKPWEWLVTFQVRALRHCSRAWT